MNALSSGQWGTPSKSVANTQQGEGAVTVGHGSCSKDLDRLEKWADWELMKAKKSKGKFLPLMHEPAQAVMQAGVWLPRKHTHRKGCGVLGDAQLNVRQQVCLCSKEVQLHPELCSSKCCQQVQEGDPAPLALVRPHLEYCIQVGVP